MKKILCLLACLFIFVLVTSGCQDAPDATIEASTKKVIENSIAIHMKFGNNSNTVIITNQEEKKKLEDLFNGAEFYNSAKSLENPLLYIDFYGKDSETRVILDKNDVVLIGDDREVKSKNISFEKLFSIFKEKVENTAKEKIENLVGKKIESSLRVTIEDVDEGKIAHLKDQEKIKKLEDLFNETKFSKSAKTIEQPRLDISFYGREDVIRFYIGKNDVIMLKDGNHIECDEISFEKILNIYNKEMTNLSKEEIENSSEVRMKDLVGERVEISLKEEIKNTTKIEMRRSVYSRNVYITDQVIINQLEDLFNEAEFYKEYEPRFDLGLNIIFYGENGRISFYIDEKNFIKLDDGTYAKSNQINFKKLSDIWDEAVLTK